MPATSVTESYNALLTTTLRNLLPKKVVDALSQGRYLRFVMGGTKANPKHTMGNVPGGYVLEDALGERVQVPLMYGGAPFDTYAGWNTINITPIDGVTSAFYPWRQAASSIVITGLEQQQNKGEKQLINLLDTKSTQAAITIKDGINRLLISGNADNGNCLVAYVSPTNASSGPDPLGLLVSKTPTSGTIGAIDSSTNTWWQNQHTESTTSSPTWATFFKELDTMFAACAVAVGGDDEPDFHLTDVETFNIYRAGLRQYSKIEGYTDADLPFENVAFRGGPVFYDKWTPDIYTGTTPSLGGASATRAVGTWFMLTSKYIKIYASKAANFRNGPFVDAIDQDGIASKVLWYGAQCVQNRAKHGVLDRISLAIVA